MNDVEYATFVEKSKCSLLLPVGNVTLKRGDRMRVQYCESEDGTPRDAWLTCLRADLVVGVESDYLFGLADGIYQLKPDDASASTVWVCFVHRGIVSIIECRNTSVLDPIMCAVNDQ